MPEIRFLGSREKRVSITRQFELERWSQGCKLVSSIDKKQVMGAVFFGASSPAKVQACLRVVMPCQRPRELFSRLEGLVGISGRTLFMVDEEHTGPETAELGIDTGGRIAILIAITMDFPESIYDYQCRINVLCLTLELYVPFRQAQKRVCRKVEEGFSRELHMIRAEFHDGQGAIYLDVKNAAPVLNRQAEPRLSTRDRVSQAPCQRGLAHAFLAIQEYDPFTWDIRLDKPRDTTRTRCRHLIAGDKEAHTWLIL